LARNRLKAELQTAGNRGLNGFTSIGGEFLTFGNISFAKWSLRRYAPGLIEAPSKSQTIYGSQDGWAMGKGFPLLAASLAATR
jgi:hypothetical protein